MSPTNTYPNHHWANGLNTAGKHGLCVVNAPSGRLYVGLRGRVRATGENLYVSAEFDRSGLQAAIAQLQALLDAPAAATPLFQA